MKLTKEEQEIILPMLIKVFNTIGEDKRTGNKIVDWMNYKKDSIGFKSYMTEQKLRKCINYLRGNGILPIMADSDGYWLTKDPNTIREMAISLRRRVASINAAAEGLLNLANEIEMGL